MTQAIDPSRLVLKEEIKALDEIQKASHMYPRDSGEIMRAAKLVEQRRQNDFLERIACALERLTAQ